MAKFDSIYNYHENLVFLRIDQLLRGTDDDDEDFYDDVACVALNQLPPYYVRHTVDAGFYMTSEEHANIADKIDLAVDLGIEQVRRFRAGPHRTEAEEAAILDEISASKAQSEVDTKAAAEENAGVPTSKTDA